MNKQILSGDEAIARGLYEAGCHVAAAYPGTPSTEILENVGALYSKDIYCEWSCNEKVASELAVGASIGGARAFAAMKHVGMNVAADPIFSVAYAGVNGGLVFLTADDPGCHSSQNEQDNRWYALHAKIAMLEPANAADCKAMAIAAFDISEQFDIPVMIRMTTRVCHSKDAVELSERVEHAVKPYVRDPKKYALLPAMARVRHVDRERSLVALEEYADQSPFNVIEQHQGAKIGVISSGVSCLHAQEAFGDTASYLKLGLTNPLPRKLIRSFCEQYDSLYIVEEGDPYLENAVRALGFSCIGKEKIPLCGELNAQIVRSAFLSEPTPKPYVVDEAAAPRPPVLCPGCPHRGFFYALSTRQKKVVAVGDIGCYALGVSAPLNAFDFCICMGAGFSACIGLSKALEKQGDKRKALGILGDSTFFHSGLTSLIDIVSAEANVVACILDNSITAMTGHQDNPGTAKNLMGQPSPVIDIVALVKALGLGEERIRIVDPLDVPAVQAAIDEGAAVSGPFVIITKRPCVLIKEVAKANAGKYCVIDPTLCRGCKMCMKIACPAIAFKDGKAQIVDPASCTGCGLCASLCKFGASERKGE